MSRQRRPSRPATTLTFPGWPLRPAGSCAPRPAVRRTARKPPTRKKTRKKTSPASGSRRPRPNRASLPSRGTRAWTTPSRTRYRPRRPANRSASPPPSAAPGAAAEPAASAPPSPPSARSRACRQHRERVGARRPRPLPAVGPGRRTGSHPDPGAAGQARWPGPAAEAPRPGGRKVPADLSPWQTLQRLWNRVGDPLGPAPGGRRAASRTRPARAAPSPARGRRPRTGTRRHRCKPRHRNRRSKHARRSNHAHLSKHGRRSSLGRSSRRRGHRTGHRSGNPQAATSGRDRFPPSR